MSGNRTVSDLTGKVVGRLTVICRNGYAPNGKSQETAWLCRCECGNEKTIARSQLVKERIVSCGCKRKEHMGALNRTHGQSNTAEHRIWTNMKTRCTNKKATGFEHYGGRGIKMCDRWLNSFEAFYKDMGPRPSPDHTIDRIDNNGNYEKSNCRWAVDETQKNNRSDTIFLELNGVKMGAAQWARDRGISYRTIVSRHKLGWTDEEILTRPVNRGIKRNL